MTNKDGGPAYPHTKVFENGTGRAQNGMSLRDYFAAKAMQGLIAADDTIFHHAAAEQGYLHADAMLAAREAPQPDPVRNELVVLLAEFLNQIDDEDQVIRIEPSGGCIECTVGTRPNDKDTGLCLRHRAEAALSKAKEGQS